MARFHYPTPRLCPSPPVHVLFSLSKPAPHLSCFVLSFWLCQQYCTVQHLGSLILNKILKEGILGPTEIRTVFLMVSSPHAHSFTKSHKHILFFYIFLCIHVQRFGLSCGGYFFFWRSIVKPLSGPHQEVKELPSTQGGRPPLTSA